MTAPQHIRRFSPTRLVVLVLAAAALPAATVLGAAAGAKLDKINPKEMPRFDYSSHVVVANDQKRVAHIAGQSAMNVNMNIDGETLDEQIPKALANFDLALKAVRSSRAEVAQMTVFFVDKDGRGASLVTRAIREYFAPQAPPALTFVGVPSLVSPAMRVEIEGTALVGDEG